jgi:hypothetical protein
VLRFIESMQQSGAGNPTTPKWDNAFGYNVNPGRYAGTYCLGSDYGDRGGYKSLGLNLATAVVGVAFLVTSRPGDPGNPLLEWWDGGSRQLSLYNDASGRFRVYRNEGAGTLLGTGTFSLPVGSWVYVEWKVVFATGATGSTEVRINGTSDLVVNAVQTTTSGNAWANKLNLAGSRNYGGGNSQRYQDLYVLDNTGAQNNDFLGDCRVELRVPSADGAVQQFATVVPNTAGHYAKVAEIPHDGDTSYVEDATVGNVETYLRAALAATSGVVRGVQFSTVAKRSDAGPKTIAGTVRIGGVNYFGAAKTPSTVYTVEDNRDILELNPATGLPFTIAEINAAEFGFKVNS